MFNYQCAPQDLRKHAGNSKYDLLLEEAEIKETNPEYAFVRLQSGHGYEGVNSENEFAGIILFCSKK